MIKNTAFRFSVIFLAIAGIHAGNYQREINKANAYLAGKLALIDADSLVTLDLVARLYKLKLDTGSARSRILKNPPKKMRIWLRDLDPKYVVPESELRALKGWPEVIAMAIYCDTYPLPWYFLSRIQTLSKAGGNGVTRGIFALTVVQWKGCSHDVAAFEQTKQALVNEIPGVIQHNATGNELWIDCILALYFADHPDWITEDLLNALAESQLKDGSWNNSTKMTAKALWVFLEARERRKLSFAIRTLLPRP